MYFDIAEHLAGREYFYDSVNLTRRVKKACCLVLSPLKTIPVAGSPCHEGQRGRPGYEGGLHAAHGGDISFLPQFPPSSPSIS